MQTIQYQRSSTALPQSLCATLPEILLEALDRSGLSVIEELGLHSRRFCTARGRGQTHSIPIVLSDAEISKILQQMCGGSLYAYSQTIHQGYLTMGNGIRVGICGTAATQNGRVIGVSGISGLIVRIPHYVSVNTHPLLSCLQSMKRLKGILIYAPPGVGKTTLLRAVAADAASGTWGIRTVVVDTREELHASLDGKALDLDVLRGYPRELGIEIAVRSLGAQLIVCDEIGSAADADAILAAANCGVPLIASAHAQSVREMLSRPALRKLHDAGVFGAYVGIRRDINDGFCYVFTEHARAL